MIFIFLFACLNCSEDSVSNFLVLCIVFVIRVTQAFSENFHSVIGRWNYPHFKEEKLLQEK